MQAGAKFIAEERGAFERGGGTATMTIAEQHIQQPATAPLWTRADMDAETIAVLAGIVGVSVQEFSERYGRKA